MGNGYSIEMAERRQERINSSMKSLQQRHKDVCNMDGTKERSKNHMIRVLFADIELLILELETAAETITAANAQQQAQILHIALQIEASRKSLQLLSDGLKLGYAVREMSIIGKIVDKIDELLRLIGVWSFLATSAVLFSIPALALKSVDYALVKLGILPLQWQITTCMKWFINMSIMTLSGINLVVEGLDPKHFKDDVAIACFSHASTMDAFILSGTLPSQQITMVKSDLFLVPFFSWLMLAFGCVPIDR